MIGGFLTARIQNEGKTKAEWGKGTALQQCCIEDGLLPQKRKGGFNGHPSKVALETVRDVQADSLVVSVIESE